ncbi:MAG: 5-(carboxyamino)imidazole ribonucleotide mutase [Bacteroidales bacterium]|jgi:5-(carboxyamino)imidazole ribonucleotide mutase|nr:5-(carboxyamino)imidazole ribonucleotide mutase [Bacteroidales bacterium]
MKVSIIMGSTSDYDTMSGAEQMLAAFGVEYETKVISAHRTPDLMFEYTRGLRERGFGVVIAGAGGAAHLAGVAAGLTTLPVIAVPMPTKHLGGLDSLLSMVQMPTGIPVATVAIGGAKNAGILAAEILALGDEALAAKLDAYRQEQADKIRNTVI